MLTLACVYRSGPDFNAGHVQAILRARRFIREDCRVVCVTDRPQEVRGTAIDQTLTLVNEWPCWWSKMELFRLAPPVLYLDLDMLVTADITQLARTARLLAPGDFLMMRDPYRFDECSAIMGWNCDMLWLYEAFAADAPFGSFFPRTHGIGFECRGKHYAGDQEYIRHMVKPLKQIRYAQDVMGGIYSYKVDIVPAGQPPADTRLVAYHGLPRPADDDLCAEFRSHPMPAAPIQQPITTGARKPWQE